MARSKNNGLVYTHMALQNIPNHHNSTTNVGQMEQPNGQAHTEWRVQSLESQVGSGIISVQSMKVVSIQ